MSTLYEECQGKKKEPRKIEIEHHIFALVRPPCTQRRIIGTLRQVGERQREGRGRRCRPMCGIARVKQAAPEVFRWPVKDQLSESRGPRGTAD